MHKSTIIATCLVNMKIGFRTIQEAEVAVQNEFCNNFPNDSFDTWNSNVSDSYAQNAIKVVGKASEINVKKFIEDLWN
jgi:hypothetical protein